MRLSYDVEQLKRTAQLLQEAAEQAKIISENMTWKLTLPDYERLILEREYKNYEMSLLGIDEVKLNKFNFVSNVFDRMKNFYEMMLKELKRKLVRDL